MIGIPSLEVVIQTVPLFCDSHYDALFLFTNFNYGVRSIQLCQQSIIAKFKNKTIKRL
jgi:hypothetical protein